MSIWDYSFDKTINFYILIDLAVLTSTFEACLGLFVFKQKNMKGRKLWSAFFVVLFAHLMKIITSKAMKFVLFSKIK